MSNHQQSSITNEQQINPIVLANDLYIQNQTIVNNLRGIIIDLTRQLEELKQPVKHAGLVEYNAHTQRG